MAATSGAGDYMADQVLRDIFGQVESWQARTEQPPAEVQSGSDLAGDDAATHYLQTSHVVAGVLMHAVDHLNALRALILKAEDLHMGAPFTLMRVAHENAATAVWLLAPDERSVRVRRRLLLARQDAWEAGEMSLLIGGGNATREKRREDIAQIAQRNGMTLAKDDRFPGYGAIVREAAQHLGGEKMHEVLWRGCSGIAHAMQWSSLAMLTREEQRESSGNVTLKLTASLVTVASLARRAAQMTKAGFELYDKRRLRWTVSVPTSSR